MPPTIKGQSLVSHSYLGVKEQLCIAYVGLPCEAGEDLESRENLNEDSLSS